MATLVHPLIKRGGKEGRGRGAARHFVHQSGKRWVEGEGHIAHKIAHNNAVH